MISSSYCRRMCCQLCQLNRPLAWQALAADLREIMQGLEAMDADLTIAAGAGAASASMLADNAELNQFVLRVSLTLLPATTSLGSW